MLPLYAKFHDYFEIKNITPILNQKLIRFACKLPNELKYNSSTGTGKLLLLELLDRYNVRHLISKKKQGFSVDTKNLWNSYGKKICKYYLDDARIVNAGLINPEWIKKYINQDELDARIVNKFLGLLALEIWYRLFISKEIKASEKLQK
jgi:asparagine synthase (glutamine-hydrolysing)